MTHYTLEEARENLPDVLHKLRQGEAVTIDDETSQPVIIVQQETDPTYPKGKRVLGQSRHRIKILPGFYEPITDFDDSQ